MVNPVYSNIHTAYRTTRVQSAQVGTAAYSSFDIEKTAGPGSGATGHAEKFSVYMSGYMNAVTTSMGSNRYSTLLELQGVNTQAPGIDSNTEPAADEPAGVTAMDTNKGTLDIDLNDYFSPDTANGKVDLRDVPLLMPSAANIEALTSHADTGFKTLLENYGIPSAPEQITYDNNGQMVLPEAYPYAEELTRALDENPGLARELQTLNALTSHYAEMQKRIPFIQAYDQAGSQAEIDAVLAKYASLLQDNGNYSSIALNFSGNGELSVTADGKPV